MRALNAVRRVLLLLVLIPVVAICLDTLLRMFGARPRNPIVAGIRDFANVFIIEPFRTVFRDQSRYQDAAVALVAFGLLALLIIFLFRGLRAMVGTRPPKAAPAAATPKPAPAPSPAPSPSSAEASGAAPADSSAAAEATSSDTAEKDGTSQSAST